MTNCTFYICERKASADPIAPDVQQDEVPFVRFQFYRFLTMCSFPGPARIPDLAGAEDLGEGRLSREILREAAVIRVSQSDRRSFSALRRGGTVASLEKQRLSCATITGCNSRHNLYERRASWTGRATGSSS